MHALVFTGMDISSIQSNPKLQVITIGQIAELPFFEQISAGSGWYPLHILCRKNSQHEQGYDDLMDKVLLGFPEAARQGTVEGWLPLHILCRNSVQNAFAIEKVLRTNFEAARIPVECDGWYPLHQVCKYSENVGVIKMIYDAFPEAAAIVSLHGKFPHQLLRFNKAFEIGGFYDSVILACPQLTANYVPKQATVTIVEAVEMTEEESRAYESADNLQQYVISTKAFRETATTPLSEGLFLLHALCQRGAPYREIKEVLNAYLPAASMSTDDGWLPLHLACRNSDDFSVIRDILEAYPAGAGVPTSEGWYPLHQLCRYSHSLDAIKIVYDAFPQASQALTPKGSTPLNLLMRFHPQRFNVTKMIINNDARYKVDIALALSVNIQPMQDEDGCLVASAVEHSPFMTIIKFDDIRNLLDPRYM